MRSLWVAEITSESRSEVDTVVKIINNDMQIFLLQGGYKIQILDHLERPKLDLTPSIKGSEFVRNDVT